MWVRASEAIKNTAVKSSTAYARSDSIRRKKFLSGPVLNASNGIPGSVAACGNQARPLQGMLGEGGTPLLKIESHIDLYLSRTLSSCNLPKSRHAHHR
jgi:hypothetical protein